MSEARKVAERYARRDVGDRYSALNPDVWQTLHERQRAMLALFARAGVRNVSGLKLTEVGCGAGGNLLELLRIGFAPEHLTGLELLPERHMQARRVLPVATSVWQGDAADAPVEAASQDIVLQSTVFSSLLDDAFQQRLADAMWRWLRPGGAVLWYDFTVDNPRNPDVRGVPLRRVRELFPLACIAHRRVTLAPPLARRVARVHPALYTAFNVLPLLRTHVLAWIAKPIST
ncbi:MAG: class I SAM-dependent methyltransferase [Betaproteobacteria bacterium]|nr:MAG: class I SAM-dependent methyltransferase [Betaproteobacteria bacterium]